MSDQKSILCASKNTRRGVVLSVLLLGACGRSGLLPATASSAPRPEVECPGIDTQTDNNNCGGCGTVCSAIEPSTAICTLGRCLVMLSSGAPQEYRSFAVGAADVFWTGIDDLSSSPDVPYGDFVKKIPIAGGVASTIASTSGQAQPGSIAVDATTVYWTSSIDWSAKAANGTIMKVPIGGGASTTAASGQVTPTSVAVDAANIYWPNDDSVMKVPIAGGPLVALASGQLSPSQIVGNGATVYWVAFDTLVQRTAVWKVPLAGGLPTTVVSESNMGGLGGFAVHGSNAYYIDRAEGRYDILKIPVEGGAATALASGKASNGGIAADATHVYWTNTYWTNDDISEVNANSDVMRVPVAGGPATVLVSVHGSATSIVVDATSVYFRLNFQQTGQPREASLMRLTPK